MFRAKIICCVFSLFSSFVYAREWSGLLEEFEQYAESSRQKCQAVGMAVAIVKDGKVVYVKGFGKRDLNAPDPVTTDTLFQIGSMSKSFTTALTAVGVDRKWLKWEDPVVDHLPSFMMYDPWVTRAFEIEDLYAQRSGLLPREGDFQPLLGIPIDSIIDHLRFYPPVSSFRSQFAYQNVFFAVGAKVLHQITGKSWETLIHEELFNPLGMNASSCDLQGYLKNSQRAGWHVRLSDGQVVTLPENFESRDWIYIYAASGGVNSTILDMAKWITLQADLGRYQGKQVISKENLSRTHRPHIFAANLNGIPNYYCLGWISRDYSPYPIIWHNGATLNVNNNMAVIPEERLGIVVLCNTRDTVVAEALTWKFFDLYFEKPSVDWTQKLLDAQKEGRSKKVVPPKVILPALSLNAYTGVYQNSIYGKLVVTVAGEGLQIEIGPRKTKWMLKHYNRIFFILLAFCDRFRHLCELLFEWRREARDSTY